ncbi:MAG: riboflavin synthase [Actinomycetota bacterium]
MFTGIVEERGTIRSNGGALLVVGCQTVTEDSAVGSSVSVNGVCLTVVGRDADSLAFDITEETMSRTALGRLHEGDPVNLERPVTLATRLGGHLVQGHVDGIGIIEAVELQEAGATLRIRAATDLLRYAVAKGSIAVDGVSLTVATLGDAEFSIALIPHTLAVTTLGDTKPGDEVNLEVDLISKYVERLSTNGASNG